LPGGRRRGWSRLAAAVAFPTGLLIGAAIGLPVAHLLVDLVIHPPATGSPGTGTGPPPVSTPVAALTPTPSSQATPSPTPQATSPPCPALSPGQHSLDALEPAPTSYRAAAGLDWMGCGDATLPSSTATFTMSSGWLIAVSYSCPTGTAATGSATVITVTDLAAEEGVSLVALAEGGTDFGDVISPGLGGAGLDNGPQQLQIMALAPCLWHVAVYAAGP